MTGRLGQPSASDRWLQERSGFHARRIITQGGASVNNRRVEGIEARLGPEDLASESMLVLRSGKKRYALLRFA